MLVNEEEAVEDTEAERDDVEDGVRDPVLVSVETPEREAVAEDETVANDVNEPVADEVIEEEGAAEVDGVLVKVMEDVTVKDCVPVDDLLGVELVVTGALTLAVALDDSDWDTVAVVETVELVETVEVPVEDCEGTEEDEGVTVGVDEAVNVDELVDKAELVDVFDNVAVDELLNVLVAVTTEVCVEEPVCDEVKLRLDVIDGDMDRVAHSAPVSKLTPHSSGSANVNRYVQSN